jgi:predicted nucleotidyltransferase component of viral defense system
MIEATMDEAVLRPPLTRNVTHGYGEPLKAGLLVYGLEEIVAEKVRATLQHVEKLERRGWSRSRARDYYDLWRVLGAYKGKWISLDLSHSCAQNAPCEA